MAPDLASPRRERPRLPDQVMDAVVERIASGSLRSGDALPAEAELARQFSVSKPVVREALRQLAALGVVQVQQGKPTTIRAVGAGPLDDYFRLAVKVTEDGLREVVELRRAIEAETTALAAERATAADLTRLGVALAQMEQHVDDIEPWVEADLAFHLALADGAHNRLLRYIMGALGATMRYTMRLLAVQVDLRDMRATYRRHEGIFEAVRARDPAAARAAIATHFTATHSAVLEILEDASRRDRAGPP